MSDIQQAVEKTSYQTIDQLSKRHWGKGYQLIHSGERRGKFPLTANLKSLLPHGIDSLPWD